MSKVRALFLVVMAAVSAALIFGSVAALSAEEKAPTIEGRGKVGFVDLQKALNESAAGKKAKVELEGLVRDRQAVITERVKARDKQREDLEKQSAALSEKARRAKAEELDRLEKAVDRLISDSNEELQRKQRDRESQILVELEKIIEKIGKDEGYSVILPADVILYAPDEVELTGRVIKLFDESHAAEEKAEGEKEKKEPEKKENKKK